MLFESEPSLYQMSSDTSCSSLLLESSIIKLKRLCKFCDERVTSCQGKRTCKVECEITAICPDKQDVCVTIWCVSAHTSNIFSDHISNKAMVIDINVFTWANSSVKKKKRKRGLNGFRHFPSKCIKVVLEGWRYTFDYFVSQHSVKARRLDYDDTRGPNQSSATNPNVRCSRKQICACVESLRLRCCFSLY